MIQNWFIEDQFLFYEYNPNVGNEVLTGWSGVWGLGFGFWVGIGTQRKKEKVILVNTSERLRVSDREQQERSRYLGIKEEALPAGPPPKKMKTAVKKKKKIVVYYQVC